jgi:hypothetical protein
MAEQSNFSAATEPASEGEEIEEYVSPQIEDKGSLNEVTQGTSISAKSDSVLPTAISHSGIFS